MSYPIIIFFLVQMICWIASERNKKKLTPDEWENFRKASFQDKYDIFSIVFCLILFFGFMFPKIVAWVTPYPIFFLLTLLFGWFLVIRISVNQAKLPKKFILIDHLLSGSQSIALVLFYYFLFDFK